MRIGIDLGGTKIEALALSDHGEVLCRQRIASPRGDYAATLEAIVRLVANIEAEAGRAGIRGARYVSGVGCNATAVNLALLPLARSGLIERAVVEVKVGSSEGGNRGNAGTHHPERSGVVRDYRGYLADPTARTDGRA